MGDSENFSGAQCGPPFSSGSEKGNIGRWEGQEGQMQGPSMTWQGQCWDWRESGVDGKRGDPFSGKCLDFLLIMQGPATLAVWNIPGSSLETDELEPVWDDQEMALVQRNREDSPQAARVQAVLKNRTL